MATKSTQAKLMKSAKYLLDAHGGAQKAFDTLKDAELPQLANRAEALAASCSEFAEALLKACMAAGQKPAAKK